LIYLDIPIFEAETLSTLYGGLLCLPSVGKNPQVRCPFPTCCFMNKGTPGTPTFSQPANDSNDTPDLRKVMGMSWLMAANIDMEPWFPLI
jgi:hypothetical protein